MNHNTIQPGTINIKNQGLSSTGSNSTIASSGYTGLLMKTSRKILYLFGILSL